MKRVRSSKNLVWIDLEMTGLDVEKDVILQAALVVTDAELNVLEEYCCDIWQPPEAMSHMSPFVADMHTKSGLLARVAKSRTEIHVAERHLLEKISGWCEFPGTLCGNSVGQDKRFLEAYMPGVARYLHYRIVDVSSLKVLTRLWYGDESEFKKPEDQKHDALFDIRMSVAELAHYRSKFLLPPT
ncbi:MAG: oligoribonuclease [Polyangiaceae bacterium]